ncbi:N-6 DNA methylase [Mesorhizobium sp. M0220]|uniref:Eco57I restriction-modification methylase domain-containing protein n=1 Tax=Mesorhizobium sp. M0220 TaxID=2956920 RepID=UPI0033388F30
MPLFHPRVVAKHLNQVPTATSAHQVLLTGWADSLGKGLYDSETKNDGQFIEYILVQLLGYKQSGTSPAAWTVVKNQPIGSGNSDAAIGNFSPTKDSILAPFELKGAKTQDLDAVMPGRGKTPVQQVWEYAMDAKGAKWALLSNYREIRLYAVGYGRKDYERFDLTKPLDAGNYERMMLLLSADNLLGGSTAALLAESDLVEKEVTDALYRDYRSLRANLVAQISSSNPTVSMLDVVTFSQTILDRILFVAFAEDRGLLPKETLRKTYEAVNPYVPKPVWENFKGLFMAIDKGSPPLKIPGYNGGLFAENPQLNALDLSNDLCEAFKAIGGYDFDTEVSVNILGHVFEQSITDIEEIKLAAIGAPAPITTKRKKDGIYYTPPHVTRYIVEQAVGGWLADRKEEIGFAGLPPLTEEDYASIVVPKKGKSAGKVRFNKNVEAHIKAWEAYDKVLRGIKVADPACGSGAFLNEVFDYLHREGQSVNSQLTILRGGQLHLFRWDTHILSENLYGVDVNSESIEITKLSLWLKTANRSEKLTYLDDNIKCGNSLVDDPAVAGDTAFEWWKRFPKIAANGGFDVIVGNPPYVLSRDNTLDQLKDYAKKHYSLYSDKINLYLLFIERSLQLIRNDGYLSFIVPNSFLGIESAAKCREHLVKKTELRSVVNLLGSTFKGVSVEAIVFCARKTPPGEHEVGVGNIGQPRDLELPLIKVPQSEWLKTPAVIFDLKSDAADRQLLEKLSALPKLSERYNAKAGLQAYEKGKGVPKQTAADVENHPFDYDYQLDATTYRYLNGVDVGRYQLHWSGDWLRWGQWLSQPRDMSLFTGERVLIREITGQYPRVLISTYVSDTYLNNKSIINVLPKDSGSDMKYLVGVLNSKVISFFHSRRAVKSNRLVFPKAVLSDVTGYPIIVPDDAARAVVSSNVDMVLEKRQSLKTLRSDFTNLLQADLGLKKTSAKLQAWHEATFAELLAEINKQKITIDLAKKGEWLKYHVKKVEEWNVIQGEIDVAEAAIDEKVCEIYGLTPEEIIIVNGAPVTESTSE